ncbi:MAG: hypothetical protein LR008_00655 [Candidatus Pacebacteria bacterium]|nr:hypothetical protein [Candidatus Paceibacterota bacterium]
MDTFFTYLKKTLVATMFVIFGFVGTYIPQTWDDSSVAVAYDATSGLQGAALVHQVTTGIETAGINIAATLSAAYDAITSWASNNLWIKEYVLDGLAWALAKQLVSSMVDSLVSWINSGFQGRPHFVQDLQGFLLEAADQAVGEYIQELGAIGSFICSPFRLDVQIAVSKQYNLSRENQYASDCSLTGIMSNIEDFTSGAQGSFGPDGWDKWINIVSDPMKYTPYGAYLSAEAGANARIINAKGEEISLLNFGDGFLSGEVCNVVHGPGTTKEECFITKPGKIIEEALSFNLDSGRQSLIAADELDEILGALLNQIANQVFTGAQGLLGLGSPTPSSYTPPSGTTQQHAGIQTSSFTLNSEMQTSLTTQKDFRAAASTYKNRFETMILASTTYTTAEINAAKVAILQTDTVISKTTTDSSLLQSALTEFNAVGTTPARKTQIYNTFKGMSLYTQNDITASTNNWELVLNP